MIHIGKVRTSARPMKAQAAKNLPRMASHGDTGSVISSSMVPVLRSSAHSRMPMAGTRMR